MYNLYIFAIYIFGSCFGLISFGAEPENDIIVKLISGRFPDLPHQMRYTLTIKSEDGYIPKLNERAMRRKSDEIYDENYEDAYTEGIIYRVYKNYKNPDAFFIRYIVEANGNSSTNEISCDKGTYGVYSYKTGKRGPGSGAGRVTSDYLFPVKEFIYITSSIPGLSYYNKDWINLSEVNPTFFIDGKFNLSYQQDLNQVTIENNNKLIVVSFDQIDNYLPRSYSLFTKSEDGDSSTSPLLTMTFDGIYEIDDELSLPKKVKITEYTELEAGGAKLPYLSFTYELDSFQLGASEDQLAIDLPTGIPVEDTISNIKYLTDGQSDYEIVPMFEGVPTK